jgi:hypothetical protein
VLAYTFVLQLHTMLIIRCQQSLTDHLFGILSVLRHIHTLHAHSRAAEHQAQQRELSAQIRLPPLHPKTAAPLTTLAAGLGCLFAGPVGEGGQILQWSPNESGSTLPPGATN